MITMPKQFLIEPVERCGEWTFRLHPAKNGVALEAFTESSREWKTRNEAVDAGKALASSLGVPSFTWTRRYYITRRRWKEPACVWLRWDNFFGSSRRDLSRKVSLEEFQRDWIAMPKKDGLNQTWYCKKADSTPTNQPA
jgi:hypothetical protein